MPAQLTQHLPFVQSPFPHCSGDINQESEDRIQNLDSCFLYSVFYLQSSDFYLLSPKACHLSGAYPRQGICACISWPDWYV